MLFMIPTLILLALSACNAEGPDADIVKKIEEFMTSIKSSPLNIGERKAKFDEFLSSLGGTYKEDYDSLIAEMKSKIGEITDENVRSLGNQLIYMFEDGDLLTDEDFDIERVKTESLAAKLTDDKKKILRDIEAEMTPKLAKTLPNYKYARGILEHSSLFSTQTVLPIVPVEEFILSDNHVKGKEIAEAWKALRNKRRADTII